METLGPVESLYLFENPDGILSLSLNLNIKMYFVTAFPGERRGNVKLTKSCLPLFSELKILE